eukprot:1639098-Amphidinium_carterae.1
MSLVHLSTLEPIGHAIVLSRSSMSRILTLWPLLFCRRGVVLAERSTLSDKQRSPHGTSGADSFARVSGRGTGRITVAVAHRNPGGIELHRRSHLNGLLCGQVDAAIDGITVT